MKANSAKIIESRALQAVPFENGFHFAKPDGGYTGKTAISLFDFENKLKTIDLESIEYHFRRQDFQKWIGDILGDEELVSRINKIEFNLSEEPLRKELLRTLNKHLSFELKKDRINHS